MKIHSMPVCSYCGIFMTDAYQMPMTLAVPCFDGRQHQWNGSISVIELPKDNSKAHVVLVPPDGEEPQVEELPEDNYILNYGPKCEVNYQFYRTGTHQITIKKPR